VQDFPESVTVTCRQTAHFFQDKSFFYRGQDRFDQRRLEQSRPDIILMAVTSQMRHLGKTGEAEVKDWQEAGRCCTRRS
jgi:hypothetical protein